MSDFNVGDYVHDIRHDLTGTIVVMNSRYAGPSYVLARTDYTHAHFASEVKESIEAAGFVYGVDTFYWLGVTDIRIAETGDIRKDISTYLLREIG